MSYILDALKKSEKERPAGSVPDVHTIQPLAQATAARNKWPIYAAAFLLLTITLAVGLYIGWRVSGTQESQLDETAAANPSPAVTTGAAPPPAVAATPPLPPASLQKQAAALPEPAKPVHKTITPTPPPPTPKPKNIAALAQPIVQQTPLAASIPATSDKSTVPESSVETSVNQLVRTEEIPQEPAVENTDGPESEELLTDGMEPMAGDKELTDESAPLPEEEAMAEAVLPQNAGQTKSMVLAYGQLPASIKKSLPELTISALFYSSKPASRLASINGRIARENQQVADDLTIEEIQQDGVVFIYQQYRFKMEVFK